MEYAASTDSPQAGPPLLREKGPARDSDTGAIYWPISGVNVLPGRRFFAPGAGSKFRVIYPGHPGGGAGPDFRDALLELEGVRLGPGGRGNSPPPTGLG